MGTPMLYSSHPRNESQKGGNKMPTEKEMKKIELATVYEIRLMLDAKEANEFTKEDLFEILDQYARDKNTPV